MSNNPMKTTKPFIINRRFKAPRALIWKAWTDPLLLKQWFAPPGCEMLNCKMDFRIGGTFLYSQEMPDGKILWGKWQFINIDAPNKIELIQSFSNERGDVTRSPFSPDWPLQTMSTTTFKEMNGETELHIEWAPYDATEIENATFTAGHDSMRGGWGGTLDRLDAYISK